jgi:hypothetical protein
LVDRRALIAKSVDGSLRVDDNADSKTSGNTRSGRSRGRKVSSVDARDVFKLGSELCAEGSAGSL